MCALFGGCLVDVLGKGERGGGSCDFVVLALHANLLCRCVCPFILSGDSGSGPILLSSLTCPTFDTYCITILTYFLMPYTLFSFRCSIPLPYPDGFYLKAGRFL